MPRPKNVKVKSELIKRVSFFGGIAQNGTLRVEYQDGAVIDYKKVPYYIYQQLIQSNSPGKFWLQARKGYKWELELQ